jgi:hypothetical protein
MLSGQDEVAPMLVYMFTSRTYRNLRAFTSDTTGGNLPNDYAPWYPARGGAAVSVGRDADPVPRAVRRVGYFLVSGSGSAKSGQSRD